MSRCVYCTEDADGYVVQLPRDGNGSAALRHDRFKGPVLVVRGPYKARVEIPANFCPMCGRNLKKEG